MAYTPLSAQPSENLDPWYVAETAWKNSVATALSQIDANVTNHAAGLPSASHMPSGGAVGCVLTKTTGNSYEVGWLVPSGGGGLTPPVAIDGLAPASRVLTITGAADQTAGLITTYANGVANPNFVVASDGEVRIGSGDQNINGTLKVSNTGVTRKGIVYRAPSGQSAAMLELQSNTGAALMSVAANGNVTAPNIGAMVKVHGPNDDITGLGYPVGTVILRRP